VRRFRFKLETVLRHRQLMESQRLQQLATVQEELRVCDALIAELRDDVDRTLREWPTVVNVVDFALREQFIDAVAARIVREQRVREGIVARLDDARAALILARQERETIERVREREHQEYVAAADRAAQGALDEIAAIRHGRNAAAVLRAAAPGGAGA
jgi:flagellar export protein FliJ